MTKSVQVKLLGEHETIALIRLRGFLDTVSAYELQQHADDLIQKGIYRFIIDFAELEYISSAGIETFHNMAQKIDEYDGEIIFVQVPEKICKIFDIIGTTTFFQIKPTVRDAVKELEAA